MGAACAPCNGVGWVGEGDTASACPTCNPNGDGRPPEPAKPGNPFVTVQYRDGEPEGPVAPIDAPGDGAEAFFSDAEIATYVAREPQG